MKNGVYSTYGDVLEAFDGNLRKARTFEDIDPRTPVFLVYGFLYDALTSRMLARVVKGAV